MDKIHKIKILFPAMHYPPVIGGIERWTKEIAERVSQKAEVFVVTGQVAGQPLKQEAGNFHLFRSSLFTLKNLSASPLCYSLTLVPFIFFKSASLIRQQKIDLIHCNGFLSSLIGWLLSKMFHIDYIITVQRIETKRGWLRRKVYTRAAAAIAASSAIADYFKSIGCQHIEIIPNGIDLSRFNNLKKIQKDKFTVIIVARLEPVKAIDCLIKAIKDLDVNLLIIGDGSQKKNLEQLADELGLKDKIKFLGQKSYQDIPQYLVAADCFVLPSIREGFGIVILEAMAAGLPVIATRVGGIPDIIKSEQNGLLVEPKNVQALVAAINRVASNSELANKLASNAKQAIQKYNWQTITNQVFNIYQNVRE